MNVSSVRVHETKIIHASAEKVWSLLSSPVAWSLKSPACYMFSVPETERLWFYLGPRGRGGVGTNAFEVSEEEPGQALQLRSQPPFPQFIRISISSARRGATRASIAVTSSGSPFRGWTSGELSEWLTALCAAIENRAPWPDAVMPAELHRSCMIAPAVAGHVVVSAAALIRGDIPTVWQAIYSPHSHSRAVSAGFIPGTPRGQPGEIQYIIERRPDGSLSSCATAVTEIDPDRGALTHRVGPPYDQTRYLLAPHHGFTRLEMTWLGPNLLDDNGENLVAERLQHALQAHKTKIESAGSQDGSAT